MDLPEVHGSKPSEPTPIDRVGLLSIELPAASFKLNGIEVQIQLSAELFVSLPSGVRGIHLSRSYESIYEVFEKFRDEVGDIYSFCVEASRKLLEKHEYALNSEVRVSGKIFLERKTPRTKLRSLEPYELKLTVRCLRMGGKILIERKILEVGVSGLTACPSLQESFKRFLGGKNKFPPTHVQRSFLNVSVEMQPDESADVLRLIELCESSLSSPTFFLVKREDEFEIMRRALEKTHFAEDIVRNLSFKIAEEFAELSDEDFVTVSIRGFESTSKYDVYAEKKAQLGELRKKV